MVITFRCAENAIEREERKTTEEEKKGERERETSIANGEK